MSNTGELMYEHTRLKSARGRSCQPCVEVGQGGEAGLVIAFVEEDEAEEDDDEGVTGR